jgi:4,5:9,10-diseco-3-hydroxy-5,9,17-trioxoandrosta-1(10),2-diene-4-oate hydrolase
MSAKPASVRAEIGVPAGSPEIEVDGVRLAVAREGHGIPVVCLSAIGHGGGDFDAFTAATKDRFEIIRIDWPGHGRSGPDSKPASATRYAELLAGALDKLSIVNPVLIGNSIGAAAAITYAGTHPVRALVACDPGGLVKAGFAARVFCGVFVRFFKAGVRRAWWYKPAFHLYYRFMVLPSPAAAPQRKRITRAATELAPLGRDAWESFRQKDADIRAVAQALDVPVWFAWAKQDRVIAISLCLPCIKAMKHASVTMFDGGHAAFLEQPEAFAREFLAFAAKLSADGAVTPLAARRA